MCALVTLPSHFKRGFLNLRIINPQKTIIYKYILFPQKYQSHLSLLLFFGLEGTDHRVLDDGEVPEADGHHGAQDGAGPVHDDVLGVRVASAAPLEAGREHGVEVTAGVVEG